MWKIGLGEGGVRWWLWSVSSRNSQGRGVLGERVIYWSCLLIYHWQLDNCLHLRLLDLVQFQVRSYLPSFLHALSLLACCTFSCSFSLHPVDTHTSQTWFQPWHIKMGKSTLWLSARTLVLLFRAVSEVFSSQWRCNSYRKIRRGNIRLEVTKVARWLSRLATKGSKPNRRACDIPTSTNNPTSTNQLTWSSRKFMSTQTVAAPHECEAAKGWIISGIEHSCESKVTPPRLRVGSQLVHLGPSHPSHHPHGHLIVLHY